MDLTAVTPDVAIKRLQGIIVMLQSDKQELERKLSAASDVHRGASTKLLKSAESYKTQADQLVKEKEALLDEINALKKKVSARAAMASEESKVLKAKLADRSSDAEALSQELSLARLALEATRKDMAGLRDRAARAEEAADRAMRDRDAARAETAAVQSHLSSELSSLQSSLASTQGANAQAAGLLQEFMAELDRARHEAARQHREADRRQAALMIFTIAQRKAQSSLCKGLGQWKAATCRLAAEEAGVQVSSKDGTVAVVTELASRLRVTEQRLQLTSAEADGLRQECSSLHQQLRAALTSCETAAADARLARAETAAARHSAAAEASKAVVLFKQLRQVRRMLVSATQAQAAVLKGRGGRDPLASPSSTTSSMASHTHGHGARRPDMLESPTSPTAPSSSRDALALSEPVDDDDTGSVAHSLSLGAFPGGGQGGPTLAAAMAAVENGVMSVGDAVDDGGDGSGGRDPWFESIRLLAHVHAEQTRSKALAAELTSCREDAERMEGALGSVRTALQASHDARASALALAGEEESRRLALQAVVKRVRLLHKADVDAAVAMVAAAGGGGLLDVRPAVAARSRSGSLELGLADHRSDPARPVPQVQVQSAARELLIELAAGGGQSVIPTGTAALSSSRAAFGDLTLAALADSGISLGKSGSSEGRQQQADRTTGYSTSSTQSKHLALLAAQIRSLEVQLAEADSREEVLRKGRAEAARQLEASKVQHAHSTAQLAWVREQAATESTRLLGEVARLKALCDRHSSELATWREACSGLEARLAEAAHAKGEAAAAEAALLRVQAELSAAREAKDAETAACMRLAVQLDAARSTLALARGRELDVQADASSRERSLAVGLQEAQARVGTLEAALEEAREETTRLTKAVTAAQAEGSASAATRDEAAGQLARALDRLEHALGERDGVVKARETDREAHAREVSALMASLRVAEDRLAAVQAGMAKEVREGIHAVTATMQASMEAAVSAAEALQRQYQGKADAAEAEASELRGRVSSLSTELAHAGQSRDALQTSLQALQQEMQGTAAKALHLAERNEQLTSDLAKAQTDAVAARTAASAAVAVATTPRKPSAGEASTVAALDEARAELDTVQASLQTAHMTVADLEGQLSSVRQALAVRDEEVAGLRSTTDRAKALLAGLQDTLGKRDAIVGQLEGTIAGQEKAMTELRAAFVSAQAQIKQPEARQPVPSPSSSSIVTSLRDTVSALTADLEGAKEAVALATGRAAEQAAQLALVNETLASVQGELDSAREVAAEARASGMAHAQRLASLTLLLAQPLQAAVDGAASAPAPVRLSWPVLHETVSLLAGADGQQGEQTALESTVAVLGGLLPSTAAASGAHSTELGTVVPSGPQYSSSELSGLLETRAQLLEALGRVDSVDAQRESLADRAAMLTAMLFGTQAECLRLCEEVADKTGQVNYLHGRLRTLEEVLAQRDAALAVAQGPKGEGDGTQAGAASASVVPAPLAAPSTPVSSRRGPSSSSSSDGQGGTTFTPVPSGEDSPSVDWRPVGLLVRMEDKGQQQDREDTDQDGEASAVTTLFADPSAAAAADAGTASARAALEGVLVQLEADPELTQLAEAVRRALDSGDPTAAGMAVHLANTAIQQASRKAAGPPSVPRGPGSPPMPTIHEEPGEDAVTASPTSSRQGPGSSPPLTSPVGSPEPPALQDVARRQHEAPVLPLLSPLARLDQAISQAQEARAGGDGTGGQGPAPARPARSAPAIPRPTAVLAAGGRQDGRPSAGEATGPVLPTGATAAAIAYGPALLQSRASIASAPTSMVGSARPSTVPSSTTSSTTSSSSLATSSGTWAEVFASQAGGVGTNTTTAARSERDGGVGAQASIGTLRPSLKLPSGQATGSADGVTPYGAQAGAGPDGTAAQVGATPSRSSATPRRVTFAAQEAVEGRGTRLEDGGAGMGSAGESDALARARAHASLFSRMAAQGASLGLDEVLGAVVGSGAEAQHR